MEERAPLAPPAGLGADTSQLLRALAEASVLGVIRGTGDDIAEANDAFLDMLGYTRADLSAGRLRWPRMTPGRWAADDERAMAQLLREERMEPFEKEYLHRDGHAVPVLLGGTLLDRDRREWMCFVVDLSEHRSAERERAMFHDRTLRLQGVTRRLSAALTADEVAEVIVTECMAALGARCGVLGTITEPGILRIDHRFGLPGDGPGRLPIDAEAPMPQAVRTARPVVVGSRDEWLARWPLMPPRSEFEAFAAVPLLFEGRARGCMGLGFPTPRAFDDGDVGLLQTFARQAAQALERSRLYDERAYVARTLQAGLLPRALPVIPGAEVALRHQALADGGEVGGDFFDVLQTGDDSWLLAIGDVCGKGTQAAVQASTVRASVRALALVQDHPADLLRGADTLLRRHDPTALCTAACASLRRTPDGWRVEVAAAGHPPPLVLSADGRVRRLEASGRMLGVGPELAMRRAEARLAPGDVLLLYTDGVIDARRGRATFGEERLEMALEGMAGAQAGQVVAAVDDAVLSFQRGPSRDDRALMAVRVG